MERPTPPGPTRATDDDAPLPEPPSTFKRALLIAAGWTSLALGALGVALPVLPTTPFVLLGAACFARSSPRLHQALLDSPRLGPYLRQWRRDRSVPPRAKRRAYLLVVITFGVSIAMVDSTALRVMLVCIGAALLVFLYRLRTGEPAGGVS